MNRQQLLSRLGQRHDIVYSTGPSSRAVNTASGWLPKAVCTNDIIVDRVPRWMGFALRRRAAGTLVLWWLGRRWRRLVKAGEDRVVAVWCFHPKFWPCISHIRPDLLIYHAYDLYHLQGQWDADRDRHEHELLARADLVVASSEEIAAYLSGRGASEPLVVENAADYTAFAIDPDEAQEPADLAGIGFPRIGYVGALNRKVDFRLLLWLALRQPAWHFVLVGTVGNLDGETSEAVRQLESLSNVHFLGFKSRQELPRYLIHMDTNLLAYRLSADVWSEGIYPLKLHEYLASGAPVVSAALPSVRPFHEVVRIARSQEEWESEISAALRENGSNERVRARRAVARQNDWEERVQLLEHGLARLVSLVSG